jgi:hypothetical protein
MSTIQWIERALTSAEPQVADSPVDGLMLGESDAVPNTDWTVLTYQQRPPIAVGTASPLSPSTMARSVLPVALSATMRATTSSEMTRGRPSRSDRGLFVTDGSRQRW